ncbi:hypothetical protein BKA69DRAFT_1094759 [Paraphysoderma sedebokerense]|nr:hypothetical protein BKA69DRAFT_1094759 [Paraphysoderma sedebokerense]
MALVNMVLSDTLCSYSSLVYYGALVVDSISPDYFWCPFSSTELVLLLGLSFTSAAIISVERYFQIVSGKTTTYKKMFWVLCCVWVFHISVGVYPIMVNMDIVSQASEVHCLPDFRRSDIVHQSYGAFLVTLDACVLLIITRSYYKIWRKAIADGFKWKDKSFVDANAMEQPQRRIQDQPARLEEDEANTLSRIPTESSYGSVMFPKKSLGGTHSSETATSRQLITAHSQQMAMTKRLATITFALYLAWVGSLFSFSYQMYTGEHVSALLDWSLGSLHYSHCILNPIIILIMDSRWKINFTLPRRNLAYGI